MEKETVGILGFGEVGKAIAHFYKNPRLKDTTTKEPLGKLDILHICIPYSKNFVETVKAEIENTQPVVTIIHSTVPVGTTEEIGGHIIHSPIRGVHPFLYKQIKSFVKYIGADDIQDGLIAQVHLNSLGIKTEVFLRSKTTELGKLVSTTYYGLCIAYHGEVQKMCDKAGVEFGRVMTHFNQTYNDGYAKEDMDFVIRPTLYSPSKHGIGGHCITQNATLLKDFIESPAIDLILKYKK